MSTKKNSDGMFGVQVGAYAALIIASIISMVCAPDAAAAQAGGGVFYMSAVPAAVVGVVLLALWLARDFSPLRDGGAGHVISGILGVLSGSCAVTALLNGIVNPVKATGAEGVETSDFHQTETWLAGVGILLIALIVVAFGRQMAREERSHLIRSLSHNVLDGVCAISVFGWCFLPGLLQVIVGTQQLHDPGLKWVAPVLLALIVLVAALLAVASYWWHKEMDPPSEARHAWVGVALAPVMLSGAAVALAALIIAVL